MRESILGFFMVLLFLYGEIFGIIHSIKYHPEDDLYMVITVPPYAWYRSIEMLWHDEFADVDWETRLANDMEVCFFFFERATDPEINKFEFNRDIEEFSDIINNYPEDKREYLMEGARVYNQYMLSFQSDLLISLESSLNSGTYKWTRSRESTILGNQLKKYVREDVVENVDEAMTLSFDELEKNKNNISRIEYEDTLLFKELSFKSFNDTREKTYAKIFRTELD